MRVPVGLLKHGYSAAQAAHIKLRQKFLSLVTVVCAVFIITLLLVALACKLFPGTIKRYVHGRLDALGKSTAGAATSATTINPTTTTTAGDSSGSGANGPSSSSSSSSSNNNTGFRSLVENLIDTYLTATTAAPTIYRQHHHRQQGRSNNNNEGGDNDDDRGEAESSSRGGRGESSSSSSSSSSRPARNGGGGGIQHHNRGEERCRTILQQLTGKPFPRVRPDWLKNPRTKRKLELDMFNEEMKLAVEYNGLQHSVWHPWFHRDNPSAFSDQIYRDAVKERICEEHGVTLIRIEYTEHMNLPEYLQQRLQELGYLRRPAIPVF